MTTTMHWGPRDPKDHSRGRVARGFTLIELIVVVALMGIMMAVIVVNVAQVDFARLKTDAGKVAGSVRYLQNLAVMNNAYYRLVIDLSSGTFHGEEIARVSSSCAMFERIGDEDLEGKDGKDGKHSKGSKGDRKGKGAMSGSSSGGPSAGSLGSGGSGREGPGGGADAVARGDGKGKGKDKGARKHKLRRKTNLLKKMELGRGISFSGMATQFRKDLREEGRGSILFFPDGTVEKAFVYVSSPDETYTVITYPVMGIARVFYEKKDDRVLEIEED